MMNWEGSGRKWSWANQGTIPALPGGTEENMKTCQDSRFSSRDSNQAPRNMSPERYRYASLISHRFCCIFAQSKTVEPEKQPLLANGSETTFLSNGAEIDNGTTSAARHQILNKREWTAAARERLGKHVPAPTDTHAKDEMSCMGANLGL
jgi:hypothetical protein